MSDIILQQSSFKVWAKNPEKTSGDIEKDRNMKWFYNFSSTASICSKL